MRKKKNKQKVFRPGDIVCFTGSPTFTCSCIVKIISIIEFEMDPPREYRVKPIFYNRGAERFRSGCTSIGAYCNCAEKAWVVPSFCYKFFELFMEEDVGDKEKS